MSFFSPMLKSLCYKFLFGVLLILIQGRGSSEGTSSETWDTITVYNNYLITCYDDTVHGSGGYATISIGTHTASLNHTLSHSTVNSNQTHTFTGNFISRACGNHFYPCHSLAILEHTASINGSQSRYITIIAPLNSSIGLMVFQDVKRGLVHQVTYVINYPNIVNCLTLTVIKYERNWLAICFQEPGRFFSCFILIDNANISLSRLQCSSLGFLSSIDLQFVSNFVHFEGGDFITFAIVNELFKLFPVLSTFHSYFSFLPNNIARFRLKYGDSSDILYVYYNEGNDENVILYDTITESWGHVEDQLVYPCSDGYQVTLSPALSTVSLQAANSEKHLNITGSNFTNGYCFGEEMEGFNLVYVDRLEGVFVVNLSSGENIRISTSTCFEHDCTVPLVYADRYIILQEISNNSHHRDFVVKVVLFSCSKVDGGCKLLNEVDGVLPQLIGYVTGSLYKEKVSHTGNDTTEVIDIPSSKLVPVIAVIIVLICLFILVITMVIWAICYIKNRSRKQGVNIANGTLDNSEESAAIRTSMTEAETNMNGLELQPAHATGESPIGANLTESLATETSSHESSHEDLNNIMLQTDGADGSTENVVPAQATDNQVDLILIPATADPTYLYPISSQSQHCPNSSTNQNQSRTNTSQDQNPAPHPVNSLATPRSEDMSNNSNYRSSDSYTAEFQDFPNPTSQTT